jgi:CRISPR-associated endonuclease/helicase Cas3
MDNASPKFSAFFREVCAKQIPYGYQCRLACGDETEFDLPSNLNQGCACQSLLIDIPTGLGKTAAVVLAWLWNRVAHPDPKHRNQWPRRLVYCLPMRTLVEQTRDNVVAWLDKLAKEDRPQVHVLMGGEDDGDWDLHPERDAILIGTQDMLLSRAFNRGYGMSRYRWPMHFGLLNNDCLWVMDETQLMGVGVETSAQLDGFRHNGTTPVFTACPTWWMSATLDESRLVTVDNPTLPRGGQKIELSEAERTTGRAKELYEAAKPVAQCSITLNAVTNKGAYAKNIAVLIRENHKTDTKTDTLTLVVVNRVSRAQEIYRALTDKKKPLYDPAKVGLIHSRFRPGDRKRHAELLFAKGDRIIIATQAVEAGVDVSARLLITELAPWSSLVQRIGRCNRYADIPDAQVLWVDIQPKDEKDELLLPYSKDELDKAREAIKDITDASPRALREVEVAETAVVRPVIRRRDLVDLFDTTPDICGQDLDVSRYIRDGDDNDVQFFWRDTGEDTSPPENTAAPHRNELCRVSIGDAVKFLKTRDRAWRWNPLEEKWEKAGKPRPGAAYLLDTAIGGYSDDLGWTGDPKHRPTPHPSEGKKPGAYNENRDSFAHFWQTIPKHTEFVIKEIETLTAALALDSSGSATLRTAALWHDVGKAHDEFQKMLRNGDAPRESELWAKSDNKDGRCARWGFRHELASALAWLLSGPQDVAERDLVAYLIAAHHGKVRLSIRSLPNETGNTERPSDLFARGIWDGDQLPPVPLGEITTPSVTLDLSFMQMGEGAHGPSWLARTVALRDRLGPFRLAYLETLLRAADARASMIEG